MTRRVLEVRVGLLVVLAAAIAVVGTMWFQKFRMTEKRYGIYVRFDDVGGLVAGDPILVNGVDRGRVGEVALRATDVVVRMGLRQGVLIPDDSRFALKSVGIMGERLVSVTVGNSPRAIAPGDTVEGELLMGLSEVMGAAGGMLGDIQVAVARLREVSEALTRDGRIDRTMENFDAASSSLRRLTVGDKATLTTAVERIDRVAARIDSLVGRHYAALDSSFAAIGRAGGRVEDAANNLSAVSDDLRDISGALRDQRGSAGRLIYDDALIRRLERTVTEMDSLIVDIKIHPGRYVTFKLF